MKSLEELAAIRAKMLEQVSLRKGDNIDTRIVVGMATCGIFILFCFSNPFIIAESASRFHSIVPILAAYSFRADRAASVRCCLSNSGSGSGSR